jgi:putative sigma-54 modulation protein
MIRLTVLPEKPRKGGWYSSKLMIIMHHSLLLLSERRLSMRITFTARHFKPSERLKEHAHKQVEKLKKYYDGILDIEIILDYIKQQQVAELVAKVYGNRLAVVEESEDMYKSIDLAVDKMERQLKRYKDKLRDFDNERISENFENIENLDNNES